MATRTQALPRAFGGARIPLPPPLVLVAGVGLGLLIGVMLAVKLPMGVALLLGALYVPLALLNLPLAIAVWIGLAFIAKHPAVWIGPNAATALMLAAWLGTIGARRAQAAPWRGAARALPGLVLGLAAWLTVSLVWARDASAGFDQVWLWWLAGAVFAVIAGSLRRYRDVRVVLYGFVIGAVFSVTIGLADNGLSVTATAYDTATSTEGRLQGGAGDPNYLAAWIIPALVIALGLFQISRDALVRLGLGVGMAILAIGFAAAQSRGGIVALVLATLVALVVMRGRRAPIMAALLVVAGLGAAWFAANPSALERITSTDQGGNGRSELWTVAGRMFEDRPLLGVGLNNYREYSRDYTRDVGTLRWVKLIAERPHVVHNTYLQLLAETGLPGLLLYLAVALLALRLYRLAARRFRAAGDRTGLILADCGFVALIAVLAAAFFLSNGYDPQIWFLIGLAPALLLISHRTDGDPATR